MPFIDKWYPLHIPILELFIAFQGQEFFIGAGGGGPHLPDHKVTMAEQS